MHPAIDSKRLAAFALVMATAVASGCATIRPVTGTSGASLAAGQSETTATTVRANGITRILVSFNDETNAGSTIVYGQNTRKVNAGASLMGWARSDDMGDSWVYAGKVSTPAGWPVLWGDPAITTSGASYSVAFLSNLAIPQSKFPAGGINGAVTYGSRGAYIGGACIYRSVDGGSTFNFYQCFGNTEPSAYDPDATKGHFYDGGSLASTPSGEIFAAYVDVTTSNIDVWRAATATSPFVRISDPFPRLVAVSHARLRAALDGSLYAAATIAANGGYIVFINRFRNGAWATPVQASEFMELYPLVTFGSTAAGQPLTVRTGPQFSFDVGAASELGNDEIRMLVTRRSAEQRLFVEGSACAADLSHCHPVPQWFAGPRDAREVPSDVFNPSVAAWRGFINLPPVWTSSFYERFGAAATTVNLGRMYLTLLNGAPFGVPVDIAKDIPVCSDRRGYWGDYDDMLMVGFKDTTPMFMRFTSTDAGKGCISRWQYVSSHLHVQSVREP
jgi:hypothetical protein